MEHYDPLFNNPNDIYLHQETNCKFKGVKSRTWYKLKVLQKYDIFHNLGRFPALLSSEKRELHV